MKVTSLQSFKKRLDREYGIRQQAYDDPDSSYNRSLRDIEAAQPKWTTFEGFEVLRTFGSNYIAIPSTGRKNSRTFDIVDLRDRTDFCTTLTNKEVRGWLAKMAITDADLPTGEYARTTRQEER